ncbi:pitrilysin family protein [Pseudonocardia eucalypti]|uniref:Pitrilysin family protein n=1 Tax=Pseudonocardia eucalypti TaxID=648755 RepID=A0ABP9QDB3_9PSEU
MTGLLLSCVLLVLAGCGGPVRGAGESRVNGGFEQYTLGNGLRVVLREDHRLPVVSTSLFYHVGPADEVAGRTGFAHLFEHLMFEGSGHIPNGEADRLLNTAGATDVNGSTSFDRTDYTTTVPSNALELALWQESDRMGFLLDALGPAELANQQSVVRNERRQTHEAAALGNTEDAVYREIYPPGHPYHANIIGSHEDIQAAHLDEARDFFRRYYVPNNASLAIVGDIDPAATKAMIEKYFGGIPRGAEVPRPKVDAPALTGEKRVTMTENVTLPVVTMAWLTPAVYTPGDAESDLAAHVLAGGRASRLHDALVRRDEIAQQVTATQYSLALGSLFRIQATVRPGHSPQELEAAIQRELDALKANGPTPSELAAAKATIRTDLLSNLEKPSKWAASLNTYNLYTGDPGYLDRDLRRYADVAPEAVKRFAADHLRSDRRVVIHTLPGQAVLPPEPPTPPAPPAAPPRPPSAEPWRNTPPPLGPLPTTPLPRAQRFELANGLPVYLVESHALPLVVASVTSRWGSAADPAAQPGLAGFTADLMDQGTPGRDAPGIAREIDSLGAELSVNAGVDGSTVQVSALSEQLGPAVGMLSDLVRSSTFPPAEVERTRRARLVDLAKFDRTAIADRVVSREVYGENHPYGHPAAGREQAVATISRDDVVRFHQQAFTPGNCVLVLSGDLTLEAAKRLAEDAFGGWSGPATRTPRPGPATPTPDRVLVVDSPGSSQTTLRVAQPMVAASHPDYDKLRVLNEVLGGGTTGRLFANLRGRHGYTYGAYSTLSRTRGDGTLALRTNTHTPVTGASVREMLAEVSGLRDAPVTADELNRAKQSIIQQLPTEFITNSDGAATARYLFLHELSPDYYEQLAARVAAVDADQVLQVARAHLRPDLMKVVALGDAAAIVPQLRDLNLGPVTYRGTDGTPRP